ncbi:spore gernimation protein GerPD [Paenibacillus sp. FJAT-26967]|uniref:spore gernimation protein GerPD n=1 Tax=Paenibacillus sp. FJAT-26967 TaxID=1729690 RepID=UPI0008382E22|nr:spore gernimation protein GerPD [Paenibacillus sp. FJAT-26967]
MDLYVENKCLQVGSIYIIGVSSSSTFLIGDTDSISAASVFDTPPESVIIGPLVPLASER